MIIANLSIILETIYRHSPRGSTIFISIHVPVGSCGSVVPVINRFEFDSALIVKLLSSASQFPRFLQVRKKTRRSCKFANRISIFV